MSQAKRRERPVFRGSRPSHSNEGVCIARCAFGMCLLGLSRAGSPSIAAELEVSDASKSVRSAACRRATGGKAPFSGKLAGDQMSGALDMGEYLGATWTATRSPEACDRPADPKQSGRSTRQRVVSRYRWRWPRRSRPLFDRDGAIETIVVRCVDDTHSTLPEHAGHTAGTDAIWRHGKRAS
jgi:hypothetical protein